MTTALATRRVSYAEYLRMEARADVRLEFVDGYVYAMTGGTPRHAQLATRVARHLGNSLEGTLCPPNDLPRELIGFTKRERRSADLSVERAPRVG